MENEGVELRKNLLTVIEEFKKIKNELSPNQQEYVKNRINIAKEILKNPNAEFHYDENEEIQLGRIIWDECRYCMKDLKEIRDSPYRFNSKNAERFCSKSCMVQYSKQKKKKKDFGADLIMWGKDFVKIIFYHKCTNQNKKISHWPLEFSIPVRSTRERNFNG